MICCFCLGNETDIPQFGTLHDAADFVHPCNTCTLTAHRKCLLEWVNDSWLHKSHTETSPAPHAGDVALSCPQCKEKLLFASNRSALLDAMAHGKTVLVSALSYSTLMTGMSTVVMGAISVGVVGLTSWGQSMMHCIIPPSIQVPLLSRKYSKQVGFTTLTAYKMFTKTSSLDAALQRGVVDPLRVIHIPLLPMVLYKTWDSSIVSCVYGRRKLASALNELVVSFYLSSLGSHKLVRTIVANASTWMSTGKYVGLLRGVDMWDPRVMIAMLAPVRWAYDVVFRFTFNWGHLDVIEKTRPRDIANHLSESHADALCDLSSAQAQLRGSSDAMLRYYRERAQKQVPPFLAQMPLAASIYVTILSRLQHLLHGSHLERFRVATRVFWHKLCACAAHDFSYSLISDSSTMKAFLTFMWPISAGEVGKLVFRVLAKRLEGVGNDKVLMLSNFIALVLVVAAKDIADLYLVRKRGEQHSNMRIVMERKESGRGGDVEEERDNVYRANWGNLALYARFPGGFPGS